MKISLVLGALAILASSAAGFAGAGEPAGRQQTAQGGAAAAGEASGPDTPVTPAQPARPEACTDGRELGPIRVQIGSVEAVTHIGQVMSLPVRVKGVCNLKGFKLWVTFNRSVVRLADVLPAPFLAGDPPVDTGFIGLRPGQPYQTIQAMRPDGTGTVDGIGTLAKLQFEGLREGYSDINLVRVFLYDGDGNEMETSLHKVRLTVVPERPVPGDPRRNRPVGAGTP